MVGFENPYYFHTALPGVMRYKNPTPNPLPASDEGAKMYLIRAETAVKHSFQFHHIKGKNYYTSKVQMVRGLMKNQEFCLCGSATSSRHFL